MTGVALGVVGVAASNFISTCFKEAVCCGLVFELFKVFKEDAANILDNDPTPAADDDVSNDVVAVVSGEE